MSCIIAIAVALLMGAEPADQIDSLDVAAQTTLKRLRLEAASWTTTHRLPNGSKMVVQTQQSPVCTRYEWAIDIQGRRQRLGVLTIQDGKSYREDPLGRDCYRQFESPFFLPSSQLFLSGSGLSLTSKKELQASGVISIQPADRELVRVRYRGLPEFRKGYQDLVDKLEELKNQVLAAGKTLPDESVRSLDALKQKLNEGFELLVDPSTGIMLEFGLGDRVKTYSDFQWVDAETAAKWKVDEKLWPDCVAPFAVKEMPDVIQIGYSGMWRPGAPGRDTDLMLLHTKSGRFYRMPFPYGTGTSGCFSPDKSKAYMMGPNEDYGGLSVFEIDLQRGESRPITSVNYPVGVWFFPSVSPDGKTIAACQQLQGAGLSCQIMLLNLETLEATSIAKPDDFGFLQWDAQGKHLFAALRRSDETGTKQLSSLCRIDLDGSVTVLREGFFPRLLAKQGRILFEEREGGKAWKTCDLTGGDVKVAGDGLKDFGFPTADPEDRIVMMKFDQSTGPRPYVIDSKTFEATAIPVPAGLWAMPAAR